MVNKIKPIVILLAMLLSFTCGYAQQVNTKVTQNAEAKIARLSLQYPPGGRYYFVSEMACTPCLDNFIQQFLRNQPPKVTKGTYIVYFSQRKGKAKLSSTVFKGLIAEDHFIAAPDASLFADLSVIANDLKGPFLVTFTSDKKLDIIATVGSK